MLGVLLCFVLFSRGAIHLPVFLIVAAMTQCEDIDVVQSIWNIYKTNPLRRHICMNLVCINTLSVYFSGLVTKFIPEINEVCCAIRRYQEKGKSNYIQQCPSDVITCPCPWYLQMAQHSWYVVNKSYPKSPNSDLLKRVYLKMSHSHDPWLSPSSYLPEKVIVIYVICYSSIRYVIKQVLTNVIHTLNK